MRKTENELRKLQVAGFYRDIDLGEPSTAFDEVEKKIAEKMGFRATTDDVMNTFKSMLMARSMFFECERRRLPYAFNWNGLYGANKTGKPDAAIIADIVNDFSSRRCTNLNGHIFKMHPGFHNDDPVWQNQMATQVRHILTKVDFD
jgi:hypothetical protein